MSNSTTPVVVTHSSTLFHDGLRQLFAKSRFRPVRIASFMSEELENYLRSLETCIWIIGVERCLPPTNALVRDVVTKAPGVKPVIFAARQLPEDVIPALRAGAFGFLCQDIPPAPFLRSLELIMLGEVVVHPQFSWVHMAVGSFPPRDDALQSEPCHSQSASVSLFTPEQSRESEPSSESPTADITRTLSRRETLILKMLVDGASNKVIARRLVITESTVKVHMKAILRKLRLQNRTQAAIWARNNVIDQHLTSITSGHVINH